MQNNGSTSKWLITYKGKPYLSIKGKRKAHDIYVQLCRCVKGLDIERAPRTQRRPRSKEEINEYWRQWRARNKDKVKEYNRKNYLKRKQKKNEVDNMNFDKSD